MRGRIFHVNISKGIYTNYQHSLVFDGKYFPKFVNYNYILTVEDSNLDLINLIIIYLQNSSTIMLFNIIIVNGSCVEYIFLNIFSLFTVYFDQMEL